MSAGSVQSELHAAVTFTPDAAAGAGADSGDASGSGEDGGGVAPVVLAELQALREENALLREQAGPSQVDRAAAQLHVAELRQELSAQQREKAQLAAETGQLRRQLNRHIEEKESALRQMRELQVRDGSGSGGGPLTASSGCHPFPFTALP